MGKMKYFLKWLENDIKQDWIKNWPTRKRTLLQVGEGAKFGLQLMSWMALVMGLTFVVINLFMGIGIAWQAVFELVFGVLLLNGIFFIDEKFTKYQRELKESSEEDRISP